MARSKSSSFWVRASMAARPGSMGLPSRTSLDENEVADVSRLAELVALFPRRLNLCSSDPSKMSSSTELSGLEMLSLSSSWVEPSAISFPLFLNLPPWIGGMKFSHLPSMRPI